MVLNLFVKNMRTQTQQFKGKWTAFNLPCSLLWSRAAEAETSALQHLCGIAVARESGAYLCSTLIVSSGGCGREGKVPPSPLSRRAPESWARVSRHYLTPLILIKHRTLIKWQTQSKEQKYFRLIPLLFYKLTRLEKAQRTLLNTGRFPMRFQQKLSRFSSLSEKWWGAEQSEKPVSYLEKWADLPLFEIS